MIYSMRNMFVTFETQCLKRQHKCNTKAKGYTVWR